MAEENTRQLFSEQKDYGWTTSLNMLKKAPAIAKRIFATYNDAKYFVNDLNDKAVEGLILTVVADSDPTLNGAYFVEQVATSAIEADEENGIEAVDAKSAILVKLSSSENVDSLEEKVNNHINAYAEFSGSVITETELETWSDELSIVLDALNDSITSAETAAKNFATESINALDAVESGSSTHVSVKVTEENGVITTVNVSEDDVASAAKLDKVYTWTVNGEAISGSPVLTASDINCSYEGDTKTVQEAISALQNRPSGGGGSDVDLSEIERDIETLSGDVASKTIRLDDNGDDANPITEYILYQGEKKIGKIVLPEIPKDLVVTGGEVIVATAQDTGLVEGEKYLKLYIANQVEPVYIAVKDLVDVYTGSNYITVGSGNTIDLNLSKVDKDILNVDNSVVKAAIEETTKAKNITIEGAYESNNLQELVLMNFVLSKAILTNGYIVLNDEKNSFNVYKYHDNLEDGEEEISDIYLDGGVYA